MIYAFANGIVHQLGRILASLTSLCLVGLLHVSAATTCLRVVGIHEKILEQILVANLLLKGKTSGHVRACYHRGSGWKVRSETAGRRAKDFSIKSCQQRFSHSPCRLESLPCLSRKSQG